MNLNDFVVLPNNKAKSVKLNARNLQELQMGTVTLANESKEVEEKLRQLKDSMSKEKEERGQSGRFRWTSGQCGSLCNNSPTNSSMKNKKDRLQKLSAGKLKIRVLKDEPPTAPPLPPPHLPTSGLQRKIRLKGTICGQCEIKTAGLMCAECTENYCIGCFARFHQKGALKLHRMIPIQTDLQTHVSTRDVVGCFQRHINPSSHPSTFASPNPSPSATQNSNNIITSNAVTREGGDESPEKGTEAWDKHMKLHLDGSQVLVVNHSEEKTMVGRPEDDNKGFPSPLLSGEYNEEESARSFQEALRQWRGEKSDGSGGGEGTMTNAMCIPVKLVSVSTMATQADLPPDREAEGQRRGGREDRLPVKVEFKENNLIHMDRLRLKKHRRTPTEIYHPPVACGTDLKSQPNTNTEEETASNLTAEEEDFRRYYATLFTAPVSRGRTEPQITTPESCLVIEVLDEACDDTKGICAAEKRTDNNREIPSVQQIFRKGRTLDPQTALNNSGSSRMSHSSPGPTQPSRQSKAQPKSTQKLHSFKPQTSQAERTALPSKSKPSACPTAETSRTSKAPKTPTSKSPRSILSPTIHKSNPKCGSPQRLSSLPHSQSQIPLFSADVFALVSNSSPEEDLSLSPSIFFPLRSTFTVSPSNSTDPTLLPKVYHSAPLQEDSDSSLLAEQSQSSQLFAEPISSPKLCESPRSNLLPRQQSQHFSCDQESVLLDNQLQLPLSPVSASPHPSPKSLEPSLSQITLAPYEGPVKTLSSLSLLNGPPADSTNRSTPSCDDTVAFVSPTPISGDHKSTLSHRDRHCTPSSQFLNAAVKMEEEEELLIDSEDEMSSDSLGLASRGEDLSDKEAQMQGRLRRERSMEEQENPAISHLQDSFVPVEAEREKDSWTDESEQLSEPSLVIHNQSAGFRSQQLCDLDWFWPQGLDMHTGHSDTPEDANCDPIHTCQSSLHDLDPKDSYRSSSRLRIHTEEHLGFRVMQDNPTPPIKIQIHSTRRGETSANGLGASEFGSAFRPLSRAAREIMEICGVDQRGCEDPDLDTDTTEHTVHHLAQELRLIAKETDTQALVISMRNTESQDQHGNLGFKRGGVSEEQKEEEDAAKRDQQSVLLLP
ncbi:uncharacterized protein zbbx [Amphiprion ocellaris]|nr:uncharacterized protein zbbx [Amphiprion ocellaris]